VVSALPWPLYHWERDPLPIVLINYTGQQRFCPMREKSVSDVFLDAEFIYEGELSENLEYFLSRNLLNTEGTQ